MRHSFILTFFTLSKHVLSACPPTGPVLPPPTNLSSLNLSSLQTSLNTFISQPSTPYFNTTTTSFAIELISSASTSPFFSYYHTAAIRNTSSTAKVDTNTVFRVASITKVFTTLAVLLQEGIEFDDWIGKWIPEVRGRKAWEGVTVGMLASQISGVPKDVNVFDLSLFAQQLIPAGFPAPKNIPTCGAYPGQRPCTRKEFFTALLSTPLAFPPASQAGYSNTAYILLGYALESLTKKSYSTLLSQKITKPLSLKSTTLTLPTSKRGIIPVSLNWWEGDFGPYKSTAGLLSTPHDLSTFAHSILTHKLLSVAETHRWLSPRIFTSGLNAAVGAPWEIYRPIHLTVAPRPMEIYSKKGGLPGYATYLILIPEFEVGAVILVAAQDFTGVGILDQLFEVVLKDVIPKLEANARKEAGVKYTGIYASPSRTSAARLEVAVDNGPGLKVVSWIINNSSILSAISAVKFGGQEIEARLYPIDVSEIVKAKGKKEGRVRWRVVFELAGGAGLGTGVKEGSCEAWVDVDGYRYGGLPIDEMVFLIGKDGKVRGVETVGFGGELVKS